jgi:hypothetical protein
VFNGDYQSLKTNSNYMSFLKDAGVMAMVSGTEKICTSEQMKNIFFSYRWDEGELLAENKALDAQGLLSVQNDSGTLRNFSSLEDAELFDWYVANPTLDNFEMTAFSNAFVIALYNSSADGSDLRAAFEAVIGEDIFTMVEGGSLLPEDVPEEYKAQAEDYGEWLAAQPAEEEPAE